MVWTEQTDMSVEVITPEGRHTETFSSEKTLQEVVNAVGRLYGGKGSAMTVRKADGSEIDESYGDRELKDFPGLNITVKTVGA
jgi:hypothetical protein